MYDIRKHVCMKTLVSPKEYTLVCKEGTFLVPDAELLVIRKKELQRIPTAQIGDGMKVVVQYPILPEIELPVQAIEAWLSVYQEYDEDSDQRATYLYKYTWGDQWRALLNTYLQQKGSRWVCRVEKWFTRLDGIGVRAEQMLPTYSTLADQLGCMIWICLWYGKPKQIAQGRVMSWHVWLPLVWSLAHLVPALEAMWDALAMHGIFIVRSVQTQQVGTLLQLTIHDAYLLDILEGIRLWKTATDQRYKELTEMIMSLLWAQGSILPNSVLKFVSK